MDYETAYKEALERAKTEYKNHESFHGFREMILWIFPELEQNSDEEILKALIEYYSFDEDGHSHALDNITPEQIVDWLKKQDKIDKTHYDIAEKEKHEFIDDGFVKCYANFQDFKEGETYSLEYLGNDNYNVSSVNLLGKIYHITPCQLYTIFKKQTWLEKQSEQKPIGHKDENIRKEIMALIDWSKSYAASGITNDEAKKMLDWLENIGEQKSAKFNEEDEKIESKFKVGDWVSISGHAILISDIRNDLYEAIFTNGEHRVFDTNVLDKEGHLWTISDAMAGDIIYATSKFNTFDFIYIFSEIKNENSWTYCSVDSDSDDWCGDSRQWWFDNCKGSIELERYDFYPATKEQRDILFAKMKEEGYGWDNDNKELEELEQSPTDIAKSEFHEGDWITFYGGCPFKILKVESEQNGILDYLLLNQNGQDSYLNKKYVDENARLWTIQDAKPGDVLVCPKYANDTIPNIFIFKDIDRNDNDVYCYCSFLKVFATGGYVASAYPWVCTSSADPIDTDFCPATKEQCDILFQKMEEAGYMWDSKNIELQKIEPYSIDMPNLKVGDWIIRKDGKNFHNGNKFARVNKIDGIMYFLDTGKWLYVFEIRAWSIYDAQAGDILVSSNNQPFIHNGCRDKTCLGAYCGITVDNEFKISDNSDNWIKYNWTFNEGTKPATKEQCDILFTKMKEAGYTWDSEKKELIKINLN